MRVQKAVITAAGRNQRTLPLQTLIDRDGVEKPVLRIIVDEVLAAKVEEICVVVCPGDEAAYAKAAGDQAGRIRFVPQVEPLGYAHAVYLARDFTSDGPFLHLVGDHVYAGGACAARLVEVAQAESCAISAVQPTRESLLAHYGTVGGQRMHGRADLYRIDSVLEKPTPTEAEQKAIVPGLRSGHYLCFFGMHVLTPAVMDILGKQIAEPERRVTLSSALAELAAREQYLALQVEGRRYDLGVRYGLLAAQVALALDGRDRDQVLSQLLALLSVRAMEAAS
jgi:UTP--glucose-1-phosphate uridylyltransferase